MKAKIWVIWVSTVHTSWNGLKEPSSFHLVNHDWKKNLQRVLIFDGIGESGRNLWIGWVYSKLLRKTMTRKSHQHVGLSLTFFNKAKPYMPNIFNNGSTFNSLNYCRIFLFSFTFTIIFPLGKSLENHL